jgi:hypothetical protein
MNGSILYPCVAFWNFFLFHYLDLGSFRAQEPFQGLKFTQFYGLSRALQNQQNGDEIIFDFSFSSWGEKTGIWRVRC